MNTSSKQGRNKDRNMNWTAVLAGLALVVGMSGCATRYSPAFRSTPALLNAVANAPGHQTADMATMEAVRVREAAAE